MLTGSQKIWPKQGKKSLTGRNVACIVETHDRASLHHYFKSEKETLKEEPSPGVLSTRISVLWI